MINIQFYMVYFIILIYCSNVFAINLHQTCTNKTEQLCQNEQHEKENNTKLLFVNVVRYKN